MNESEFKPSQNFDLEKNPEKEKALNDFFNNLQEDFEKVKEYIENDKSEKTGKKTDAQGKRIYSSTDTEFQSGTLTEIGYGEYNQPVYRINNTDDSGKYEMFKFNNYNYDKNKDESNQLGNLLVLIDTDTSGNKFAQINYHKSHDEGFDFYISNGNHPNNKMDLIPKTEKDQQELKEKLKQFGFEFTSDKELYKEISDFIKSRIHDNFGKQVKNRRYELRHLNSIAQGYADQNKKHYIDQDMRLTEEQMRKMIQDLINKNTERYTKDEINDWINNLKDNSLLK